MLNTMMRARPRAACAPAPRLFEANYQELRRIARQRRLAGHAADEAQISALIHETYIRYRRRLTSLTLEVPPDKAVFLRVVTLMMRSVAIDRYRRDHALRRGAGKLQQLSEREPTGGVASSVTALSTVIALDVALDRLRREHPDWFAAVIERDLVGRSEDETASRLAIASTEVRRRRRRGLAWMRRSLGRSPR